MSHSKPVNVPEALTSLGLRDVEPVDDTPDTWMWGPLIFKQTSDGGVYIDADDHNTFEQRGPFYTRRHFQSAVRTLLRAIVKYGINLSDAIEAGETFTKNDLLR